MGNSIASCVECVDDDTSFPRAEGMNNSSSMVPLPNPSATPKADLIPVTSETTDHIVEISVMKPLGITLCDSETGKGVYVTAIKDEGNVKKLPQKLSVGMLILELNGVDVSTESLENVIKMISDSSSEKRMILRFRGTKPVEAPSTSAGDKESSSSKKEGVSHIDNEDIVKEEVKTEESLKTVNTQSESPPQPEVEKPLDSEDKDDKSTTKVDKIEDSSKNVMHTPERSSSLESGGDQTCCSMETVDMSSPHPTQVAPKPNVEGKDLDQEFSSTKSTPEKGNETDSGAGSGDTNRDDGKQELEPEASLEQQESTSPSSDSDKDRSKEDTPPSTSQNDGNEKEELDMKDDVISSPVVTEK